MESILPTPDSGASSNSMPRWIWKAVALFWLGYVLVYFGTGVIRSLRTLILIFVVSLFISFAIEPAVNRMEGRGIRRGIGTWIMFLAILLALGGFSAAVGAALAAQLTEFVDEVPAYLDDVEVWINDTFNADVNLSNIQDEFLQGGKAQDLVSRYANDLVNLGTTLITALFHLLTAFLFVFYLVAEGPKLRRTVCSYLPESRQAVVLEVWDLAVYKTGGYILSRSILAVLSAAAHWVALTVIGVPFPLALALFVGVVSQFIPVVGTYLAGALPLLVATLDNPKSGLLVLAFVVVYQQVENYLFAPRITAHTMELHVAVAFAAVLAGSALLGPIGAVLSLPFAATVQAFSSTYIRRYRVSEAAIAASGSGRRIPISQDPDSS